jgi:hypothetical protein
VFNSRRLHQCKSAKAVKGREPSQVLGPFHIRIEALRIRRVADAYTKGLRAELRLDAERGALRERRERSSLLSR